PPPVDHPGRIARWTSRLAGAALIVFLMAALVTTAYKVARGDLDLFPQGLGWAAFLNGDTTRELAHALSNAPLPAESARLERGFSWLVAGDLGPRVRQGCPGWLFLSDEFMRYPHAEDNAQSRAREVLHVKNALGRRHIALVVAVVPDKSRIAAAHLCGLRRPAASAARLDDWVASLRAEGVDAINLAPVLAAVGDGAEDRQGAYLRTDTHWNEAGAQAAAEAVARAIRRAGITVTPRTDWTVHSNVESRAGDLVRLAGLDWLPARLQPPRDRTRVSVFTPTQPAAAAAGADDLFGDDNLPNAALIGTSFSRNSNFVPFLESALRARIPDFAKDGGDFAGAANAYFGSAAFRQTPPRLVIWEIPERVIEAPRNGDAITLRQP
uniref:alginate O-acetyltransferase AlgX-related protein n=1 Tax=Bordetella sputigena TaxID=1416810 RepID=UPI0039EE0883